MKIVLFVALVFSSLVAQAAVKFRTDSQVPEILQAEIRSAIDAQCLETRENNWQVTEVQTLVREDRVDNGLTDVYFQTEFDVYAKESDSNHSRHLIVVVESMVTYANNGVHTGVHSISGCR